MVGFHKETELKFYSVPCGT